MTTLVKTGSESFRAGAAAWASAAGGGTGSATATATASSTGGGLATATATAGNGSAAAWASARDGFVPPRRDPCAIPLVPHRHLPVAPHRHLPAGGKLPPGRPAGNPIQPFQPPAPQKQGGGLLDTIGKVARSIPVVGPVVGTVMDAVGKVKEKGILGAGLDLLGNVFGGRIGGAVENGKNAFDSIKKGDIGGAIGSGLKAIGSLFGF